VNREDDFTIDDLNTLDRLIKKLEKDEDLRLVLQPKSWFDQFLKVLADRAFIGGLLIPWLESRGWTCTAGKYARHPNPKGNGAYAYPLIPSYLDEFADIYDKRTDLFKEMVAREVEEMRQAARAKPVVKDSGALVLPVEFVNNIVASLGPDHTWFNAQAAYAYAEERVASLLRETPELQHMGLSREAINKAISYLYDRLV